jgi:hypothetical protein
MDLANIQSESLPMFFLLNKGTTQATFLAVCAYPFTRRFAAVRRFYRHSPTEKVRSTSLFINDIVRIAIDITMMRWDMCYDLSTPRRSE